MLVIGKESIKVAIDDLKHDLFAYEHIQKGLHSRSSKDVVRFTKRFTPGAESLISEEKSYFGRQLLKSVVSLVSEICSFSSSAVACSDLKALAARPVSLYFQDQEKISSGVLKYRIRQVCIVSSVYAQAMGIGTLLSTRNFSTQRYTFIKHPMSFFSKRQKMLDKIRELFSSISSYPD